MEKYYKDNTKKEFAVLINPEYGGGWSTQEFFDSKTCEFIRKIVPHNGELIEFLINNGWTTRQQFTNKDELTIIITDKFKKTEDIRELKELVNRLFNLDDDDCAQLPIGCYVEWVKEGERFIVHEYDGAESIKLHSEMQWLS